MFTHKRSRVGGMAAGIQSLLGTVTSGSLFAIFQGAAMGGQALGVVNGFVQVVGVVGIAEALWSWVF